MLTVFVYARLWRRAGVMTDVEFAELRYAGRPAAFLRGFRALYLGLPINCIVIGWVNLAMMKILQVTLGLDADARALGPAGAAGVHGVLHHASPDCGACCVTDLVQFVLKMGMVVALAYYAVRAVGGLDGARGKGARARRRGRQRLAARVLSVDRLGVDAGDHPVRLSRRDLVGELVSRAPSRAAAATSRSGSSRRATSATGMFATLWFNIAHYAVRPWPWILTALASIVLYPTLVDKESGYVRTLMDPQVFPPSLRGIMLAAFAAAYMSTIGTQLNWGASYVVNDVLPAIRAAGRAANASTSSSRRR